MTKSQWRVFLVLKDNCLTQKNGLQPKEYVELRLKTKINRTCPSACNHNWVYLWNRGRIYSSLAFMVRYYFSFCYGLLLQFHRIATYSAPTCLRSRANVWIIVDLDRVGLSSVDDNSKPRSSLRTLFLATQSVSKKYQVWLRSLTELEFSPRQAGKL